jgi:hypothetical protein
MEPISDHTGPTEGDLVGVQPLDLRFVLGLCVMFFLFAVLVVVLFLVYKVTSMIRRTLNGE